MSSSQEPADLTEWVNEKEAFYIKCQGQFMSMPVSSYLCAHRNGKFECKPTVKFHNKGDNFMLFQLIRAAEDLPSAASEEGEEDIHYWTLSLLIIMLA